MRSVRNQENRVIFNKMRVSGNFRCGGTMIAKAIKASEDIFSDKVQKAFSDQTPFLKTNAIPINKRQGGGLITNPKIKIRTLE
jgi:hypothetical protein